MKFKLLLLLLITIISVSGCTRFNNAINRDANQINVTATRVESIAVKKINGIGFKAN